MTYRQITSEERYTLMVLRGHGLHVAAIARVLGRHRSTIGRELQRNRGRSDGYYRPPLADWYARSRRSRSRRNQRFSAADWRRIHTLIREDWSPEQVAGRLRLLGELRISHETIYRHIWADLEQGGTLHRHLRCARRKRRKRYGTYERRGRVSGKRPITSRPAAVETRAEVGHWESDTMVGPGRPCVLSLVGAEDRLPGARPAGGAHHRRSESPRHRADPGPATATAHDHFGQRHRVPRLRRDRAGHQRALLLRDAAPCLGTGDQREHERPDQAIHPAAAEHGAPHPARLPCHRTQTEPTPQKAVRLPHPGGMLCPVRPIVAVQS